jgi:DNA-binding NtrC family response regulator
MDQKQTKKTRVLTIEDDANIRKTLVDILNCKGYETIVAGSGTDGLALISENPVEIALLDLWLPDGSGTVILKKIKESHPSTQVIILTADVNLETAVECMRYGACDYLTKPVDCNRLFAALERAITLRAIKDEVTSLQFTPLPDKLDHEPLFSSIVTCNRNMRELFRYTEVIAASREPVLITGETGVGKELFAQAIHRVSGCPGAFIAVNVAGLDDMVFSDTLFGHNKGAFTGADEFREGLVSKASDGTLFLDEIGDLPESSQIKLLRLIQEHEYYRLGKDSPERSSARIIIATNRDLKQMMQKGVFRKDLFYRLSIHQIQIPPLRERLDDLPLLLNYYVDLAARYMGKSPPSYPRELITLLSTYDFPGNVRELQARLFDMVARNTSGKLSLDGFKTIIQEDRNTLLPPADEDSQAALCNGKSITFHRFPTLKEAETVLIDRALELARGNQGIAATLLGISRQALNNRLRRNN